MMMKFQAPKAADTYHLKKTFFLTQNPVAAEIGRVL